MLRRKDRPGIYTVQWVVGDRRVSRNFDSREAAEAEAAAKSAELMALKAAGLTVDLAEWTRWLDFKRAIGAATLPEVLAVWTAYAERAKRISAVTVAKAAADYLHLRDREGLAGDSYTQVKNHVNRFAAHLGNVALADVSADWIRSWMAGLPAAGYGPYSVAHHHKNVRAFLARCVREGWIERNEADRVTPPKIEAEEIIVLSADDTAKLFRAVADRPVSLRLALEAFGGLRYSSACRIRREDVNWTERGILLPGALHKSGRRHYLEKLPENLWTWLEKWRDVPAAWAMTKRQILAAKSEAFATAKVANPGNVLRHSFASYHVALHSDAAKTAVLMQHTNQAMLYRHYKGVATAADAAAYFAIVPR